MVGGGGQGGGIAGREGGSIDQVATGWTAPTEDIKHQLMRDSIYVQMRPIEDYFFSGQNMFSE